MLKSLKPGGDFICRLSHKSVRTKQWWAKKLGLIVDLDEVMDVISDGFDVIHAEVESIELDESDSIVVLPR